MVNDNIFSCFQNGYFGLGEEVFSLVVNHGSLTFTNARITATGIRDTESTDRWNQGLLFPRERTRNEILPGGFSLDYLCCVRRRDGLLISPGKDEEPRSFLEGSLLIICVVSVGEMAF